MPIQKLFAVSALAAALGAGAAQAQKVAIIDMQGALLATSDGKKAAQQIDAKFAPIKAEMEQLQKTLQTKQDALLKGRATMSPAAISAAQAEIDSLTTSLTRKNDDAKQDLQDEENKLLGGIMPKLQQIINTYAAANQISVVVDTSANPNNLIYADSSTNITVAVIGAYEKAAGAPAPAVTPKTAAPAAPKPGTAAPPKTTAPVK